MTKLLLGMRKLLVYFLRIGGQVPYHVMLNLYYSLVYPHLQYCNLIWGCAPNLYTNKILLLEKKIERIITKSNYLAHTNELFARTNILKIGDLNKYLLDIYAYKLARRDQLQTAMHSYNTRLSSTNVRPAYQRLSVTQNSLSFTILHVWNSIPADLKNLCFQI